MYVMFGEIDCMLKVFDPGRLLVVRVFNPSRLLVVSVGNLNEFTTS